jgi:WhiB family redox-sensing transcriptional regulator
VSGYTGQVPDTKRPADWRSQAACLGKAAAMHPDNNEREIATAKAICARCPVRVECFWDAVRTGDNEHGVRAGLRANERRARIKALQRQRKKAAV